MALDSFQKTIVVIAGVGFIITFIFLLYSIKKGKENKSWPPIIGDCPDYWIDMGVDGSACLNRHHLGSCNLGGKDDTKNFAISPYNNGDNCAKMDWATRCGVVWDGITTSAQKESCSSSSSTK